MIELDQKTLGAVKMISENDNHHPLSCLRVHSHGNRRCLLALPPAPGNEGYSDQQRARGYPAERPSKPDPTPFRFFIYRQGAANGLPDLFTVIFAAYRRRQRFHSVEISAQLRITFGA